MNIFNRISEWKFERRMANQRKKKKFADCDCWGMHYWITDTFADMIITLRDMKHGAPDLPFEEFDKLPSNWLKKELEIYKTKQIKNGYSYEVDIFAKWYIILTRIAYCLKQANEEITEIENEYSDALFEVFHKNTLDLISSKEKGKPKLYTINTPKANEELRKKFLQKEDEIFEYRDQMKNEAFDLLKKYFWNLWD